MSPPLSITSSCSLNPYVATAATRDDLEHVWEYARRGMAELGVEASRSRFPGEQCDVTCRVVPSLAGRPESYRIIIESTG